jgi:hypothetical protein
MAALHSFLAGLPAEQLVLLCGIGPFFVMLTAAFAVSHISEARKYTGEGL